MNVFARRLDLVERTLQQRSSVLPKEKRRALVMRITELTERRKYIREQHSLRADTASGAEATDVIDANTIDWHYVAKIGLQGRYSALVGSHCAIFFCSTVKASVTQACRLKWSNSLAPHRNHKAMWTRNERLRLCRYVYEQKLDNNGRVDWQLVADKLAVS